MAYTCNFSPRKEKAAGSGIQGYPYMQRIQGQIRLCKTLFQTNKTLQMLQKLENELAFKVVQHVERVNNACIKLRASQI